MKMKCALNIADKFPIIKWLPKYSFNFLQRDFVAGITVSLMVIPQSIAYAVIAGLPLQYGLYSAFMGGIVYCIFGSCKDLAVGPAAIMALMTGAFGRKNDPNFAITLSLFTGIVLLVMGVLSLGFVVRLIPLPVISGFTSAAAVIIAGEQLPNLLGISQNSDNFFTLIYNTLLNIKQTELWDMLLGISCMTLLEFLRTFGKIKWPAEADFPPTLCQIVSRKLIWVMEIGRNAVVVFACTLIAIAFHSQNSNPFILTGPITQGLPRLQVPELNSKHGNRTVTTFEMLNDIGIGLIAVPMIAFLTSSAIAQAFSRKNDYSIDASQELIALGLSNIAGSFVSGFPIAGCFSRTTVNSLCCVATQFGGVVTSFMVLLSLGFLTPFFQYIPKSSLAAVIIVSVLRMVDIKILRILWDVSKAEVFTLLVTFLVCLYEIAIGIICGISLTLVMFLYNHMIPKVNILYQHDHCYIYLDNGLSYLGIEHMLSRIRKKILAASANRPQCVIINCHSMLRCDFTVAEGFQQIVQDCQKFDIKVVFLKARQKVKEMLVNSGLSLSLFEEVLDEQHDGSLLIDSTVQMY